MKTKTLLTIVALLLFANASIQSQEPIVIFTAIDSVDWVQLDSIKIINRSEGMGWDVDTMLYYPDTVLYLPMVGLPETQSKEQGFRVFQNYPNPAVEQTKITLYIPEKDKVTITITDVTGRKVFQTDRVLEKGYHAFSFTPGKESVYFFVAAWRGVSENIRIINANTHGNGNSSLEYAGFSAAVNGQKSSRGRSGFVFTPGDLLLFVGYTDTLESGIANSPGPGELYTFQFAYNIPCPGTPTIEYEGQTYNTVQIFSQCWMKENLNVGKMISGLQDMSDNDTIEKYCNKNNEANCDIYGGLYQWDELMQYTADEGGQGICPEGWHIPTGEEWKILQGAADNQYGIGDQEWDGSYDVGYDVGLNLKAQSGWNNNGNGTDLYGFTTLPGGKRETNGIFDMTGLWGWWWTSSVVVNDYSSWLRIIRSGHDDINRHDGDNTMGCSVRCIKDREEE